MSLHQLVANALWKFGNRPVWLSIFPPRLQLCCVKSQTRRLGVRCGNAAAASPAGLFCFYCGGDPHGSIIGLLGV